ncbi:uncharacterized protein PGTG_17271 [Puccinia graminis f. sp. tritici CRL 75-36-700-3]|uniref:Myb/SANT-like domain-containing protein n=1 Tax=Puccinia graminis f. sp. tritici (strain CRL 75-36-700-3 / race SCCL) TaxID=418459 RepID=E3L374_PUCGT|nr:uncharacterized protein PGTG_17271 [Puccinia graminis f. sp. tritici CRL 75-36-700-3]EFP90999.1 hypothetical protein PGTG_17271 [Puccinia graminis f. sp. tritici CRL 75-36-700-3]
MFSSNLLLFVETAPPLFGETVTPALVSQGLTPHHNMIDPTLFQMCPPAPQPDASDTLPPPLEFPPDNQFSATSINISNSTPKTSATTSKAPGTTPKTPTQAISSKPPAMNSKSLKDSGTADGNAPHTWSTLERCKLLELIYDEMSSGHATDNGNLKKEGWTAVMNGLNEYFSLNLNCNQIKNQKNALCTMFFDYKFLCDQSGFGWDSKKFTVTADARTWDELIQAHPRRNFGKLKDKPFPIYELAERVFVGNFATGDNVNKHLPPDEDPVNTTKKKPPDSSSTAPMAPTTTSKKRKNKKKKEVVVSDSSDSDSEVQPSNTQSQSKKSDSSKRIRGTKGSVVTNSISGLIGAINHASDLIVNLNSQCSPKNEDRPVQPDNTSSTQQSISAQALKCLASLFLNNVEDDLYI